MLVWRVAVSVSLYVCFRLVLFWFRKLFLQRCEMTEEEETDSPSRIIGEDSCSTFWEFWDTFKVRSKGLDEESEVSEEESEESVASPAPRECQDQTVGVHQSASSTQMSQSTAAPLPNISIDTSNIAEAEVTVPSPPPGNLSDLPNLPSRNDDSGNRSSLPKSTGTTEIFDKIMSELIKEFSGESSNVSEESVTVSSPHAVLSIPSPSNDSKNSAKLSASIKTTSNPCDRDRDRGSSESTDGTPPRALSSLVDRKGQSHLRINPFHMDFRKSESRKRKSSTEVYSCEKKRPAHEMSTPSRRLAERPENSSKPQNRKRKTNPPDRNSDSVAVEPILISDDSSDGVVESSQPNSSAAEEKPSAVVSARPVPSPRSACPRSACPRSACPERLSGMNERPRSKKAASRKLFTMPVDASFLLPPLPRNSSAPAKSPSPGREQQPMAMRDPRLSKSPQIVLERCDRDVRRALSRATSPSRVSSRRSEERTRTLPVTNQSTSSAGVSSPQRSPLRTGAETHLLPGPLGNIEMFPFAVGGISASRSGVVEITGLFVNLQPPLNDSADSRRLNLLAGFCKHGCSRLTQFSRLVSKPVNVDIRYYCRHCSQKGLAKQVLIDFHFRAVLKIASGECLRIFFTSYTGAALLQCSSSDFLMYESRRETAVRRLGDIFKKETLLTVNVFVVKNGSGCHVRACSLTS